MPAHVVHIVNPTRHGVDRVTIAVGAEFAFGRQIGGVGRISEDPRVSRHHGLVQATAEGVSVTSTSRRNGFVVRDRATPSRLTVPRGVGPVPLPFREFSIVLEHCVGQAPYLDVEVEGLERADRWHASWGPQIRRGWFDQRESTAPPLADFHPKFAGGTVRAWFKTLVALCEPQFGRGPAGIPTNADLAARRFVNLGTIERDLTTIYRVLDIEHRPDRREIAAVVPVITGAVTPADLAVLDGGNLGVPPP